MYEKGPKGKNKMYNNRDCTKSTSHHKAGGRVHKIQGTSNG